MPHALKSLKQIKYYSSDLKLYYPNEVYPHFSHKKAGEAVITYGLLEEKTNRQNYV
jgi:hypothetical protein